MEPRIDYDKELRYQFVANREWRVLVWLADPARSGDPDHTPERL